MDQSEPIEAPSQVRAWIAAWVGVAIVTVMAVHRMRDFPAHLSWSAAWDGIRPLLGDTVWAAIKVWVFWGWSAIVIAGLMLRIEPELDQFDAMLVGAGGLWVVGNLLGNLLGPIYLFNSATIWGLLALGTAVLWRKPPALKFRAISSGQKLAALAVILLAISYLPLQLGSPVVPFMDVLSYPASVQRILTFGVYQPFNNDPYGCWGPYAQTPALELFYALLGLGSHTYRAVLAESAAMLPMAALLIFATWRIGKALFDDSAGGAAALFLFFTCLFRRAQGMRGTAVDFALVGLGLAFFLSRRSRVLFVTGALMLGTSIASHAIDGAFAMIIAGVALILWAVESDYRRFAAGVVAIAGAMAIALPEFLIALQRQAPYPVIPIVQLAGVAAIVFAARWSLGAPESNRRRLSFANCAIIAFFLMAVFYRHAAVKFSLYQQIADNLPMLALFAFGGLVAALAASSQSDQARYAGLAATALLLGIVGEYLDPILRALSHSPSAGMMASDIGIKLWDYWCPYFLTLPAGFLFGLAYERWSRPATFFALLALLIYPWHQIPNPIDYDSVEHSITEQWAFNLHTAAEGYWAGHTDRRWTFTPDEMNLIKVLDGEVEAGRITPTTHVLHLCESISVWSMVQFSVLTGINDDPIELEHDPNNLWEGGSRVRGMNDLGEAFAARPPYILEQVPPPRGFLNAPDGYQMIYDSGPVRLYRRDDLSKIAKSPGFGSAIVLWIPGILALGVALFLAFGEGIRHRREFAEKSSLPASSATGGTS